jgi:hypothetical protein
MTACAILCSIKEASQFTNAHFHDELSNPTFQFHKLLHSLNIVPFLKQTRPDSPTVISLFLLQGCQIFLGPNIPKREQYTKGPKMAIHYSKWPYVIPNDHTLYQMAIHYIYTKSKITHTKCP